MGTETIWTSPVSSPSPAGRSIRHLLIISRYHPGLYDYVSARFEGEDSVEVILDRRRGERRGNATQVTAERRSTDRRVRPHIDDALRMESMQFVTISRGRPTPSPRDDADASDRSV
jgi:hypothetical protein